MMTHFTGLLNSVVKNVDQSIGKLPMLTDVESKQLLVGFNNTTTVYPASKTIVEIFEEQAKKYPSHVALVYETKD
jgi:non-ribosomal peptide synthetase component F